MDSFFKFVRRSQTLPDIHHQETRRHFFENQCRVLGEHISTAKDIFSDHALCPESALPELQRVVRIGETLVEGCQNEICAHKAYLRQEERTKAFEETLTEILWCISVVFCSSVRCLSGNPSLAMGEFPQAMLGAKEKYVLHKAALADEGLLLASLDIWIDKHVCSVEECGRHQGQSSIAVCLAAQIRKRIWKRMASISKGSDPKSSLWITVQNALVDGVQIGKGSFGTVFETKWLGDVYAKKEFDTHCKDFADEANALAKLNHPHIVKVFTASSESCTPCFFLMEKMPCDLRTLMNLRMNRFSIISPFSISAGIDLMLQISEAMSYMNSEGMVHRDLKAANILVEPVGDQADYCDGFVIAKLADFGLAKVKHEVTSRMTRNTGTRLWMAPEVFGAHPEDEEHLLEVFPRKADVYSFGIVCSEILTGKSPLYNVHFELRELYKLITDPKNPLRPELPQSCPASLASLICKCWQTDPVMRPTFKEISTILRYFKGHFMMEGRIEEFQEANGRFSVDEAQKMIKELKETIKNFNLELTKLQESKSKAVHENEAEIKQLQNEKEAEIKQLLNKKGAEINQLQKEVDAQRFSVDEAQKIIKELKETNKNLNLQLTKLQASKSKAMHEKEAVRKSWMKLRLSSRD
ncbi:hypothetical protein KC19_9G138400 [Ceratodon purpureus]|uniref:Protein kinase domain-containing protein n=1 Tax=Ceratodon purpureus TaxID=3225 RepID=A0A8T0GX73_CERPU|nr:hypothetical protein KC19_9G138400 [Ceratodon purpureus]